MYVEALPLIGCSESDWEVINYFSSALFKALANKQLMQWSQVPKQNGLDTSHKTTDIGQLIDHNTMIAAYVRMYVCM